MDFTEPEKLQILKHSIKILHQNPKITPSLICRLSIAILIHTFLTHSLFSFTLMYLHDPDQLAYQWLKLTLFQLIYLIFIYTLVSNFSVSVRPADPPLSDRLLQTAVYLFLLYGIYLIFNIFFFFFFFAVVPETDTVLSPNLVPVVMAFGILTLLYLYLIALWNLASVVCVLEPVYGFPAVRKSYQLLKGKVVTAGVLGFGYVLICGAVNGFFYVVVVHGESRSIFVRVVAGGFLVGLLLIVNFVSLVIQSVFYYVCKSYHHDEIDEIAMNDLLGGYLGE